jgi:exopolysaccharide biosynthesis polyprenyl glycosylphosphotransferase
MSAPKRRWLDRAFKGFDVALMCLAFGVASIPVASMKSTLSVTEFLALRIKIQNVLLFLLLMLVWHALFSLCGLYMSKRLSSRTSEAIDVVKATTLVTISQFLFGLLFGVKMFTLTFLFVFWFLTAISALSARLVLRNVLAKIRAQGRNSRLMLILGSNSRAVSFARGIETKAELGYRILGFVDNEWTGMEEFRSTGYPLCCDFDHLSDFLRRTVVDEVAIYLPLRSFHEHASRIASLCEQHGIIMRFDPDIFNLKIAKPQADVFDDEASVMAYTGTQGVWPAVFKRILDFALSMLLLMALAPLFCVVALFIKITSKGPVFFIQQRVGLNKRRFPVYKFRTMVQRAEQMIEQLVDRNEVSGPVFKIRNDPRVTPIGSFLRRTSIDELPQLLNVLKGDMSLVGPRPMAVRDYEGFNEDWQRRRFSVRPGITCLWQVKGRSSIPFDQWMELDMQYVDEWSFWLDIKILAQTIPAVMRGSGAS